MLAVGDQATANANQLVPLCAPSASVFLIVFQIRVDAFSMRRSMNSAKIHPVSASNLFYEIIGFMERLNVVARRSRARFVEARSGIDAAATNAETLVVPSVSPGQGQIATGHALQGHPVSGREPLPDAGTLANMSNEDLKDLIASRFDKRYGPLQFEVTGVRATQHAPDPHIELGPGTKTLRDSMVVIHGRFVDDAGKQSYGIKRGLLVSAGPPECVTGYFEDAPGIWQSNGSPHAIDDLNKVVLRTASELGPVRKIHVENTSVPEIYGWDPDRIPQARELLLDKLREIFNERSRYGDQISEETRLDISSLQMLCRGVQLPTPGDILASPIGPKVFEKRVTWPLVYPVH